MNEKERKKLEYKLHNLLLELLDTERSYVADLEKVWTDYSPLLESSGAEQGSPVGGRKKRSKSQAGTQMSIYFSRRRKVSELKTSQSRVVVQNTEVPSISEYKDITASQVLHSCISA